MHRLGNLLSVASIVMPAMIVVPGANAQEVDNVKTWECTTTTIRTTTITTYPNGTVDTTMEVSITTSCHEI